MNLARLRMWSALVFLVVSCNSQGPSDSRDNNSIRISIPSFSGPEEWTADQTSKLTLLIRERLFGIWKTTELDLLLAGSLKLNSDDEVLATFSGDLRQIRSDDKRRDEYLLDTVFTSEASGVFSCSTRTVPSSEVPEILPFVLSGTCSIMGTTSSVFFQIDNLSYTEAFDISGSALLSLDAFGVPDISQEPVVKVARQVEARFWVRFVNDKSG